MSRQLDPSLDRRAFLGGSGALALGAPALLAGGRHGGEDRAVRAFLEGYKRAWVRRDPDAVVKLFTPDAVYQEQAFQPAYVGRAAIRGYWASVTAAQSDIELRYGKPVVADRRAAVEWWVNMRSGGAEVTLAGEFLLTFARDGLCSALREYWFFSEGRVSPPPGWGA